MAKVWINNPGGAGFYGCECLREWWPLFTAMAKKRGIIKTCFDVSQGSYNYTVAASGGTHDGGGAWDQRQYNDSTVKLAREMGVAGWKRTPAQGFSYHFHGVLVGCPHNGPARYQVDAYHDGYNGLGYMGRKAKDDGWRPYTMRNWKEGVAWAKSQTTVTPAKTTTPTATKPTGALPATGVAGPDPISFKAFMVGVNRPTVFNGNVKLVQEQLKANGNLYPYVADGKWGPKSKEAYRKYQLACGFRGADADGIPGFTTFKRLMEWRNTWKAVA